MEGEKRRREWEGEEGTEGKGRIGEEEEWWGVKAERREWEAEEGEQGWGGARKKEQRGRKGEERGWRL